MKTVVLIAVFGSLVGCTITDEDTRTLDVTAPKFAISVNGTVAHSTLSPLWEPIACDDGSVPSFTLGATENPGITVPLNEDLASPVYPVQVDILTGDDSGIRRIYIQAPPGPITASANTVEFLIDIVPESEVCP